MMLRETLMGLARVRREVNDLRRQYRDLLQQLPAGYASTRKDGSDLEPTGIGRSGFDAAFDEVLAGLAVDFDAREPAPAKKPPIDWDEWERTTKARIRGASAIRTVTTGPAPSTTGSA